MFFSVPVVASQDLEVRGIAPPLDDQDQATIFKLVSAGAQMDWSEPLAARNFKYVLLARESDWMKYGYLDGKTGLVLVGDFGSILLYRNPHWQ
jgi:hypothetical protein